MHLRGLPGYSITSSGGKAASQQIDAEATRCRQIDDEFESGCARHRQIGRFGHARLRCAIIVRASSSELAFIVRLSPVTRLRNV
jgi:hypothetical protein